jgi:type III restriction protein res subunit
MSGKRFETQRVFLKEKSKSVSLIKKTRNLDDSYVDEYTIRNRMYNFFKIKYNLLNTQVKNIRLLDHHGFQFSKALSRKYLTYKYTTFWEVIEVAQNISK